MLSRVALLRVCGRGGVASVRLLAAKKAPTASASSTGAEAEADPIQALFLEKIREYKTKQQALGEGKLVDATAASEKALAEDVDRVRRVFRFDNDAAAQVAPSFDFPAKMDADLTSEADEFARDQGDPLREPAVQKHMPILPDDWRDSLNDLSVTYKPHVPPHTDTRSLDTLGTGVRFPQKLDNMYPPVMGRPAYPRDKAPDKMPDGGHH